jgi:uncharacterized protein with HEPN domain
VAGQPGGEVGFAACSGVGDRHADVEHPQLPWPTIVAMRNVLVHDYFGTDLDEVWRTVERDLPALERAVKDLLNELNSEEA